MMLSNLMRSRMPSSMNVSAMPDGSATPLASSRMYSGRSVRVITCVTAATKSSRMLQQTQPLARLMTFPSLSTPTTSSASMLIEPKSFTNTATRRPWLPLRMRLSSVVLPAPRKPVSTVSGIGTGRSLKEWLTTCIRTLFPRGVWLSFNHAFAEFAELILIGEDGEDDRHQNEDFPQDKVELRAAIDQDDYGKGIDEKQT